MPSWTETFAQGTDIRLHRTGSIDVHIGSSHSQQHHSQAYPPSSNPMSSMDDFLLSQGYDPSAVDAAAAEAAEAALRDPARRRLHGEGGSGLGAGLGEVDEYLRSHGVDPGTPSAGGPAVGGGGAAASAGEKGEEGEDNLEQRLERLEAMLQEEMESHVPERVQLEDLERRMATPMQQQQQQQQQWLRAAAPAAAPSPLLLGRTSLDDEDADASASAELAAVSAMEGSLEMSSMAVWPHIVSLRQL